METGVNDGTQTTEVWEIIVLGGCPVPLTLRNQTSCPCPQWAPPAPRSLWSHGLQPSQRPCSLPPAYQNEVMAVVPTLGGSLPALSSCLQGFHTSLWQPVEVASLDVAQG